MTQLRFDVHPVGECSPEEECLLYEALYRSCNLAFDPKERWLHTDRGGRFISAYRGTDNTLTGCLRLMPTKPGAPQLLQIRQVAVDAQSRRTGVGRALMQEAERIVRDEGITEIWLEARQPAWDFYEALGYTYTSEAWISELTKILHRTMHKYVSPQV